MTFGAKPVVFSKAPAGQVSGTFPDGAEEVCQPAVKHPPTIVFEGTPRSGSASDITHEFLRFDELFPVHIIRRVLDPDLYEVQRSYPMIYIACHTDHVRSSSTKWNLSSYDSSILAHLDLNEGMSPRSLADHLGVAPSTLSAALSRLAKLGYIESRTVASDRRRRDLRLTRLGAEAMASTSVLDLERVRKLLSLLSPTERSAAVKGLNLLAAAARKLEKTR